MKLIRLATATLFDTKCRILVENMLSDSFSIETGFKQGDRLSTLSYLALEKVARGLSVNWNGTIFNTSKQLTAFADGTDLLGRGHNQNERKSSGDGRDCEESRIDSRGKPLK